MNINMNYSESRPDSISQNNTVMLPTNYTGPQSPFCSPSTMRQRIEAAKDMLRIGTETTDVNEAERILFQACDLLENWADDFEELQHHQAVQDNPFCILLAQAKHRLAQVCVLKGNLELACRLFLQVLLHDPETLSPSALAMTWYDVGLIYITYRKIEHAQAALKQAMSLLHLHSADQPGGGQVDETMKFFIEQAIKQVQAFSCGRGYPNHQDAATASSLPWSVQFTMTTYSYDDSAEQQHQSRNTASSQDQILEETRRLLDPSAQHASAA